MQVDPPQLSLGSWRPEFERVKRQVEQARGLFVRQPVSSPIARACRVIDGLVDRASRCRLREVVSEFGQRRIRHVLRETLNGVGHASMESHPAWGTQLAVQRLPYQCVHELKATAHFLGLPDELRARRLLNRVQRLATWQIPYGFEESGIEFATDDGRNAEQPIARFA